MTTEGSKGPHTPRDQPRDSTPGARFEQVVASLGARQYGVVTRRQLLAAGVGRHLVDGRLREGRLRPIHRGVYHVGPVMDPREREMAACLACGPSAAISHGSALVLWEVLPRSSSRDRRPPDVALREGDRRRPGIRIHRLGTLRTDEVTTLHGIPVTTPARSLYDYAGDCGARELERAVARALERDIVTLQQIERVLARNPGRPASSQLRALLERGQPALTRSEAEARFLALVRKAEAGEPKVNVPVAGYRVDFYWPEERLVVEIDGFAFRSSRKAFEADRSRDLALAAAGVHVVRVTWRQLVDEPESVLFRLGKALALAPRG